VKIVLTIGVEDWDDVDEETDQLTTEAYDRLYEAVTDAGFAVDATNYVAS
jgi:hypothetical protein